MQAEPNVSSDYPHLSLNERNADYICQHNPRKLFPLVDNKLYTKSLLAQHDINAPALVAALKRKYQVKKLETYLPEAEGFVIKPAKGSAGKGILVVQQRCGEQFVKASGEAIDLDTLKQHCLTILAGNHSLNGHADSVVIEQLVKADESMANFSYEGMPDVRIIAFKGYPVMGMMRLTTKASEGKANLHQGAVGVGIDISSGKARHAVMCGSTIEQHPDTGQALSELSVPHWQACLLLAAKSFDCSGLGFLGVDIVIDKHHGPMVLELNVRPGLSIQVANQLSLKPRLARIAEETTVRCAEERVQFCRALF